MEAIVVTGLIVAGFMSLFEGDKGKATKTAARGGKPTAQSNIMPPGMQRR